VQGKILTAGTGIKTTSRPRWRKGGLRRKWRIRNPDRKVSIFHSFGEKLALE
jgi:hypothetical protein